MSEENRFDASCRNCMENRMMYKLKKMSKLVVSIYANGEKLKNCEKMRVDGVDSEEYIKCVNGGRRENRYNRYNRFI
jgi:hypothetical protein